ncbi:MAG: HIT domain-containing protein [Patescibacteria group bacterium]
MKDFSKYIIKGYKYWEVTIHENQGYLGRSVIWCKRPEADDLSEIRKEEYDELLLIINEVKDAIHKVFKPDWFNYAFLGNEVRHLHAHVVPRYASGRYYEGMAFEDKFYGHNFQTDPEFKISEEMVLKIKEAIAKELN